MNFDAIIVAGGTGSRLGGIDKAALEINGVTLFELTLAAVAEATNVVAVGPPRPSAREVLWCREQPVGSGPAAAVLAGLTRVRSPTVVLLAVDMPGIAPAIPRLLAALQDAAGDTGAAVLVDPDGRPNYLAAAWRAEALSWALAGIGNPAGAPMRAIYETVNAVTVPDTDGWGTDCDTEADLVRARQVLAPEQ